MGEIANIKLTPKQNAVVWCLQNGWQFITTSESAWVVVANKTHQFQITSALFYKLYNMGLINQEMKKWQYDWVLTPLGKEIKTKPVIF